MRTLFTVLSKGKTLRGSAFDVFAYTAERREEKSLINWYETLLHRVASSPLPAERRMEILEMPLAIRGYGPVKSAAIKDVKTRTEAHFLM